MKKSKNYDYVVVGAGSAGCVLANQLTQDATGLDQWSYDQLLPYFRHQEEIDPSVSRQSAADIDAHIQQKGITSHHPLGTCRISLQGDAFAVVDHELRVFGADNLGVVDASMMPDLIAGNINAPVMMIAGKIADRIIGR